MAEKVAADGRPPISGTSISHLSSVTALARFEFEPGRGNEGTKILMVEWQDDDTGRNTGSWHVSWAGKTAVLPADEKTSETTHRAYFLLPPNTTVPAHISLSYQPPVANSGPPPEPQTLTVLTLPAIFTPELGATSKQSGKKGVLHTIWAKRRLQVLEREIKREEELNVEGVALEMAISERDWIESSFGMSQKGLSLDLGGLPKFSYGPTSPSLQSPRSPGGRRLSEMLKGLSIGTGEKDLAGRGGVNTPTRESHPLSPEASDVAYSSFSSFSNGPTSPRVKSKTRTVPVQNPAEQILQQHHQASSVPLGHLSPEAGGDVEEELFAIALSPRTPDISKSPFSFSRAEVAPFSRFKRDQ